MQANLLFGQADPASLTATVREKAVDVLTVQELITSLEGSLRDQGLEQLLPHHYLVPDEAGGGGAGIYSRYPLTDTRRSAEHTSELQSLMRISYAVFCLQKQTTK